MTKAVENRTDEEIIADTDTAGTPCMVDGSEELTEDQARDYLVASGYEAEADRMFADAKRFPCNYFYTVDRHRYLAHLVRGSLPGTHWWWVAGDCTKSEERIRALGRVRRARGGAWS